jgi:hypothetical protein
VPASTTPTMPHPTLKQHLNAVQEMFSQPYVAQCRTFSVDLVHGQAATRGVQNKTEQLKYLVSVYTHAFLFK